MRRDAQGRREPDGPVDDGHRTDRPRRCARCPAEREGADPAWSRGPEGWLCPDCTRRHVRDIEAKLAPEWW